MLDTKKIRRSYCTPSDVVEIKYHGDLMRALDEVDRLRDALKPAYVEPAANGRDLIMTDPVREHVFELRKQLSEARQQGFATGVVYALARLVEMYDQPNMADDILNESRVDVRMAAEYDVAFLRRENQKLAKGRE
jgi:hypothetical protein